MTINLPAVSNPIEYQQCFKSPIWQKAAALICSRHKISCTDLVRSPQGENIIFFVDRRYVIKLFAPFRHSYLRDKSALENAEGLLNIELPEILFSGEIDGWSYLVMTQLSGHLAKDVWSGLEQHERLEIVTQLGGELKNLHSRAVMPDSPNFNFNWQEFIDHQVKTCLNRQEAAGANPQWIKRLPDYIAERIDLLPAPCKPVLLHGDVHLGNLFLKKEKRHWQISGLFDFGDSLYGFHEYDFVAPGVLMVQGNRELQRALLLAYGYTASDLTDTLRARLMLLTILYECSNLKKYALRLRPEAVNYTLDELETAIWTFAVE